MTARVWASLRRADALWLIQERIEQKRFQLLIDSVLARVFLPSVSRPREPRSWKPGR